MRNDNQEFQERVQNKAIWHKLGKMKFQVTRNSKISEIQSRFCFSVEALFRLSCVIFTTCGLLGFSCWVTEIQTILRFKMILKETGSNQKVHNEQQRLSHSPSSIFIGFSPIILMKPHYSIETRHHSLPTSDKQVINLISYLITPAASINYTKEKVIASFHSIY